jgi:hypothetical protein
LIELFRAQTSDAPEGSSVGSSWKSVHNNPEVSESQRMTSERELEADIWKVAIKEGNLEFIRQLSRRGRKINALDEVRRMSRIKIVLICCLAGFADRMALVSFIMLVLLAILKQLPVY